MLPAHQRFGADQLAARGVLPLDVQTQLLLSQCLVKLTLDLQALAGEVADGCIVKGALIAPADLGLL
ncbi:hypothetical protein SDC9_186265 [bioreactor metagenome]|uniref:Uncharacterized protein n=1 Tax=bioreactor metagenome TaxID=1076179 RepID=A0A645HJ21_9ZZZZ